MARPMPGAQRAPGHRARRVEPFEHVRQIGRRDAGAVVVDVELDRVAVRHRTPTVDAAGRELQRVLHEVGDDLRQPLRVGDHRDAARRRPIASVDADLGCRGLERLDRVADDAARVDRSRDASENWCASSRARSRRSATSRSSRRDSGEMTSAARIRASIALDRAVGDRLRVAADRRQRRAQVVRDAEQEGALVAPGDVEVARHRVDRVGQAAELVVADVRSRRPGPRGRRPRSSARSSPSPRADGSAGARRYAATSAAMPSAMAAAPSTASPLPPNGRVFDVLGEHEHGRRRRRPRRAAARRTRCRRRGRVWVRAVEQRRRCRGRRRSTPVGQAWRRRPRCRAVARAPPATLPSASTATTAPFEARSVVFTRSRIRRSWRRPATVAAAARDAGSCADERVELGARPPRRGPARRGARSSPRSGGPRPAVTAAVRTSTPSAIAIIATSSRVRSRRRASGHDVGRAASGTRAGSRRRARW